MHDMIGAQGSVKLENYNQIKEDILEANRQPDLAKASRSPAHFSTLANKMKKIKTPHVSIALKKPLHNQDSSRNTRNSTRLFVTQLMSSGDR